MKYMTSPRGTTASWEPFVYLQCRVMKDKLMEVLKNNTGVDEPDEVALILTPTEVENTPPCVLAALG